MPLHLRIKFDIIRHYHLELKSPPCPSGVYIVPLTYATASDRGPQRGRSLNSPYQGSHGSDNADMGIGSKWIRALEGHFKEVPLRGTNPFLALYPYLRCHCRDCLDMGYTESDRSALSPREFFFKKVGPLIGMI